MIRNLGWTDLHVRRKNSRLVYLYKILNGLVAIPVSDQLIPADKRTRGGHSKSFKHIRSTTTVGQNSFLARTIPEWNLLPTAAVQAKSVAAFKGRLAD